MSKQIDLSNPATAKAVARRAGVVAKGRFSQNFLIDGAVVEAIADALGLQSESTVVEIGPGLGTLTKRLAETAGQVIAIEIDPACVRACEITLRHQANVTIVEGDARDVDLQAMGVGEGWLAAGNLPYHLTGALLSTVLEQEIPPARGVFMVQREVARRLADDGGGWSLATVAVRSLADVEIIRDVPPHSFDPAPKVYSSVIRLTPLANPMPHSDRVAVLELARRTFQMRRKTLRHGIGNWLGGDLNLAARILAKAEIDAGRRPGTLDLAEWRRLNETAIRLRSTDGK